MEFELFAAPNDNNAAFQAGMLIGILMAVIISAGIPIAVGISKGHPVLGVIGGVCAGGLLAFWAVLAVFQWRRCS